MIDLYVHPTCTSCRKAESLLRDRGAEFSRRDYFRDRFTADELRAVLARAGKTPVEALSVRAKAYRELGLADREVTDDELIELMIAEPTLLRRPLAIGPSSSVVGFNATQLDALAVETS